MSRLGPVFCHGVHGGARNEDTRNFVKHFILTTRRSQRLLEHRYTHQGNDVKTGPRCRETQGS